MGKFHNAKELQVKVKSIKQKVPAAIDKEMNDSAERIKTKAQQYAPFLTGNLMRNIVKRKILNGYIVRAEADYSRPQEQKRRYMERAINEEMNRINSIPQSVIRSIGVG